MRLRHLITSLALTTAMVSTLGPALAQPPLPKVMPPGGLNALPKDAPPPKAVPAGPYKVIVEAAPGLPTHTVYRPADLKPFGNHKLPIVAFGEGGCWATGRAYEVFLTKIASHGFFVVAVGPENVGLPDLAALKPGEPLPPMGPATPASELIRGIDWAIAEDGKGRGPYSGTLNRNQIGVMGQSCGGLMALAVSNDPRVKTTVLWNSGVFVGPGPGGPPPGAGAPGGRGPGGRGPGPAGGGPMGGATKDSLKALHAPVAYFIGGPSDIAYLNAEDDFKLIQGVPLFNGNLNVGHGGTFRQPNGGRFGEVGAAWLLWQLKGDRAAGRMFVGPDCTLCRDPVWTVKKKNMK